MDTSLLSKPICGTSCLEYKYAVQGNRWDSKAVQRKFISQGLNQVPLGVRYIVA